MSNEWVPHLFPVALMRYNEGVKEARYAEKESITTRPKRHAAYLNDEYGQLCRELTATLCRKLLTPTYN